MNAITAPTSETRNRQIKADATKAIATIAKWFARNPKAKTCKAVGWYGRLVSVNRRSIRKDIFAAAAAASAA